MSPTFAPGHDLVGRYRILELLGVGATAEVYLAEDLTLQRRVVVKVLLGELSAYEDVRRSFRDHIIRAATLNHPQVARVFDGGQESGSIFMVTEFLSGGSLEDVLRSGRVLGADDTARLGRDVSAALAYLHANGFVHGSLSPSKLLFDEQGLVRVSDIALAGLGEMHREQLSFDDVRYLSPEQALGGVAVDKSDVYALALILYESVTGESPFESATPEVMLRRRINTPLPVRAELGTLDMVLAQAAVPDPRVRLDAEQFASRLSAVAIDVAPLSLRHLRAGVPLLAQFPASTPRSSIGFRPPSADEIVGATAVVPIVSRQYPSPQTPRRDADTGAPTSVVRRVAPPSRPRATGPIEPPPQRRLLFFVLAVSLVLVAVVAAVSWQLGFFATKHTVPSLIGMNYQRAAAQLKAEGFTLSVTQHSHSSTTPPNDVLTQNPTAGTRALAGQTVNVTVSEGPVVVVLTNILGQDCVSATAQLAAMHVTAQCPSSASVASSTVPSGRVASVIYKNTTNPKSVPLGSTVTLALSTGPVVATTTTTVSPTTTTPTTTTTAPASTTTTTALGQGPRAVPNVVGDSRSQVYAAMRAASLYFSTTGPGSNSPAWTTVVAQTPAAGTVVPWHSSVTLQVK